ncbi:MAG: hypothetical protein NVSMB70_05260 [Chamaesiphon sp.]
MKFIAIASNLLLATLTLVTTISIKQVQAQQVGSPRQQRSPIRSSPSNNSVDQRVIQERYPNQPLSINSIPPLEIDLTVGRIEESFTHQFEQYWRLTSDTPIRTQQSGREILNTIEKAVGVKPAIIYVSFFPNLIEADQRLGVPQKDNDQLELVVLTAKGFLVRKRVDSATRKQVNDVADAFRQAVSSPISPSDKYLPLAQQLYQWIISPIESDLQARNIHNLVFIMDAKLRSLPVAALYDGNKFLVQKYSVGLMPSLSLTDTRYVDIKNSKVLAMGTDHFIEQEPLPAVPIELSTITQRLWPGRELLDQAFTPAALKAQRSQEPFGIVHLGTHAVFAPGELNNSFIQFSDRKVGLEQVRQLGFNQPPVELLVLSACNTALGDRQAELGFAGFAAQSGAKSALASLWTVNDVGTLGLMTDFYEQLKQAPIKAEALRLAQVEMIEGQVRFERGYLHTPKLDVALPPIVLDRVKASLQESDSSDLSHPYYWSAFTMVGNPW